MVPGAASASRAHPRVFNRQSIPSFRPPRATISPMSRAALVTLAFALAPALFAQAASPAGSVTVLHAAHLLDVEHATLVTPGEVLIRGSRIAEAGSSVAHPADATVIDLGSATLMPGLIDAHVHLFLHPGAEDLQTVVESVPERTILATIAARDDLLAGFTAERDMGTEGAGSADSAVRNAINAGLIPGPRLRISGNAVDILGGHEDAIHFNPAEHISSNATYANYADELVAVIRQQLKEGADFIKIYETGPDRLSDGQLITPYQYTRAELEAAVAEAARLGTRVGVHSTGEPGHSTPPRPGLPPLTTRSNSRRNHAPDARATDLRRAYLRHLRVLCRPRRTPAAAERERAMLAFHAAEFRKQLDAGVPMAVGSDVGPFPHGTQAREFELMVKFGMTPADGSAPASSTARGCWAGPTK